MKKNKVVLTLFILLLCVGMIHGARFFFGPHGRVTLDKRILNRSKGNPAASVWIVEYMDYQCPSCRLATKMLDAYFKQYPSKLYLQIRFHPLKQHPHGLESALYAECAMRQKKFWEFHHLLFENQSEWRETSDATQKFHDYAKEAGLDLTKLDACLVNPLTKDTVLQENIDSVALGIHSTPTFFINGKIGFFFQTGNNAINLEIFIGGVIRRP